MLADWLEVPNLGQQSQALLDRLMARFFLGIAPPADRSLPQRSRGLLVGYALASALYRWLIVLGILWFCYRVAKAHGLEVIALGLAFVVIAGMVTAPVWNLARFLNRPATRRGIDWTRAWLLGTLTLAAVVLLVMLPLPFHVTAPAVFQPHDARMVYVTVPGRIAAAVAPGDVVHKGQVLARLANLDVDREIVELTGQCNQQRLQLQHDRVRLIDDPQLAAEIPWAESALADLEARLQQRQQDREGLTLRAPCDGVVLPPPLVPVVSGSRRQLSCLAWKSAGRAEFRRHSGKGHALVHGRPAGGAGGVCCRRSLRRQLRGQRASGPPAGRRGPRSCPGRHDRGTGQSGPEGRAAANWPKAAKFRCDSTNKASRIRLPRRIKPGSCWTRRPICGCCPGPAAARRSPWNLSRWPSASAASCNRRSTCASVAEGCRVGPAQACKPPAHHDVLSRR